MSTTARSREERNAEFDAADDEASAAAVSAPKPISALAAGLKRLSMSLRSSSLGRRSSSRARGEDSTGAASSDAAAASVRGVGGGDAITTLAALLAAPASALLRPQASILCLDPGTTVGDALAALAARRVLSAPVRTLEAAAAAAGGGEEKAAAPEGTTPEFAEASRRAAAEGRSYVCFVDVRDVLMSFLEVIPEGALDGAKLLRRAKVLEEAGSRLSGMPLSSLPVIGSDGAFLLDGDGDDAPNDGGGGDEESRKAAAAPAPALSSSMPLRTLLSDFLVGGGGKGGGGGSRGTSTTTTAVSEVRQGPFPRARAVAHRVALLSPPPPPPPKKVTDGGGGGGGDSEELASPSSDQKQRVTHIVSQLDAARFVLKHAAALGPLALKTAAELGWAEGKVVTVPPTAPAIEALAAMRRAGVAGLAVVESGGGGGQPSSTPSSAAVENSDSAPSPSCPSAPGGGGAMIGSFAVPDLRSLVCEHLGSLALPVGEALAKARGREFWGVARSGGNGNGGNGGNGERSGNATPVGSFGGRGSGGVPAPPFGSTPLSSSVGTPTASALFGTSPRDASAAAAAARRASIGGRVGQALATASPDDSFSVVLARLVARRVHRLHVIDDETSAPLGVVTLTDALGAVLAAAEKEEEDKRAAAKAALV